MNEHEILQSFWHNSDGTWTPWSAPGLGRVKTFSCRRSELGEVATRAFSRLSLCPDRGHQRLNAHNVHHAGEVVGKHVQRHLGGNLRKTLH